MAEMSEVATTPTESTPSVDAERSQSATIVETPTVTESDPAGVTDTTSAMDELPAPNSPSTSKRKHEEDEATKEANNIPQQSNEMVVSPPKKPATAKQNLVAELDETSAKELNVKTVLDQVSILSTKKLDQLKSLHSGCVGMISEELYLERNLAYVDYSKWVAPQHLLNRDKLDYLNSKVQSLSASGSVPTSGSTSSTTESSATKTTVAKPTMAERAKHEASILQRIAALRKQGLWSIKRLPKLVEPARAKTHWDYLLDECSWMATDFEQERRWKQASARKISQAVQRYFRERQQRVESMEREEAKRVRKQCSLIAKEVQSFWKQVEKLIELRMRAEQDEKRRNVMDMHLNIIVGQTEEYSKWLVEGLNADKKRADSSVISGEENDNEFVLADDTFRDDESTIEEEEKLFTANSKTVDDELEKLRKESELPLDDLLKDYHLDSNYFLGGGKDQQQEPVAADQASTSNTATNTQESEEESGGSEEETTEDEEEEEEDEDESMDEESAANEGGLERLLDTDNKEGGEAKKTETVDEDSALASIAQQAQSLQPTGYTLETTHVTTPLPTLLLKHTLREYQHVGLDWLVTMYENKLNGILADEMGLGKTIQTIALFAHLAEAKSIWGPHLIVVPTSVMLNWELEFKKWAPGFKILTYYGSQRERRLKRQGWSKPNAFHVCITSYKLVVQDHSSFRRKKWKYFVLDEAHNIKNFKSQRWQSLLNFQSQRRLLLTGTPLQNNLMELWSLMHFLMPHVFSSHKEFAHWFSNPLNMMIEGNSEYNEQLIKRLHKVLRPFILRRLKSDVEKQMPKKYEHIVTCPLSKRQRFLYDEFMSLASTREKLEQGNYISVINILMQLRKVCNHPDLFETRPIVSSFICEPLDYECPSIVFNLADFFREFNENMLFLQSNMSMADLDRNFSAFNSFRSRQLQTPKRLIEEIMCQTPPAPVNPSSFVTSPFVKTPSESKTNEQNDEDKESDKFFHNSSLEGVPSPRSATQRRKKSTALLNLDPQLKAKTSFLIQTNKQRCAFLKPIYGADLYECLRIVGREKGGRRRRLYREESALSKLLNITGEMIYKEQNTPELVDTLNRFVLYIPPVIYATKRVSDLGENGFVRLRIPHPTSERINTRRVLVEQINQVARVESVSSNRLSDLVSLNQSTQFPEKRLIQYDCGKLQILSCLLRRLITEQHRALIFTQMTRMLDILENFLNYHGFKYLRLDGSTPIEKRQTIMERFNADKRIFCMILSTRSGGIGVNLTGADTVVFYDSDWNPTMDAQAQDRCHRIGQTRDVNIYRLISEKTVEENILRKANQKRLLNEMTIEGGNFTTALLKRNLIAELFEETATTSSAPIEPVQPVAATTSTVAETSSSSSPPPPTSTDTTEEPPTQQASEFEKALALVEDESDVKAADELRREVKADFAEFDENQQLVADAADDDEANGAKLSRIESEFKSIEKQLKPVERYALRFLEKYGEVNLVNLNQELEIEKVKKDWELNRLKQLKEEEERKAEEEEDDLMMYTYTKTEVRSYSTGGQLSSLTNSKLTSSSSKLATRSSSSSLNATNNNNTNNKSINNRATSKNNSKTSSKSTSVKTKDSSNKKKVSPVSPELTRPKRSKPEAVSANRKSIGSEEGKESTSGVVKSSPDVSFNENNETMITTTITKKPKSKLLAKAARLNELIAASSSTSTSLRLDNNTLNENSSDEERRDEKKAVEPVAAPPTSTAAPKPKKPKPPKTTEGGEPIKRGRKPKPPLPLDTAPPRTHLSLSPPQRAVKPPVISLSAATSNERPKILTMISTNPLSTPMGHPPLVKTIIRPSFITHTPTGVPLATTSAAASNIFITKVAPPLNQAVRSFNIPSTSTAPKFVFKTLPVPQPTLLPQPSPPRLIPTVSLIGGQSPQASVSATSLVNGQRPSPPIVVLQAARPTTTIVNPQFIQLHQQQPPPPSKPA